MSGFISGPRGRGGRRVSKGWGEPGPTNYLNGARGVLIPLGFHSEKAGGTSEEPQPDLNPVSTREAPEHLRQIVDRPGPAPVPRVEHLEVPHPRELRDLD